MLSPSPSISLSVVHMRSKAKYRKHPVARNRIKRNNLRSKQSCLKIVINRAPQNHGTRAPFQPVRSAHAIDRQAVVATLMPTGNGNTRVQRTPMTPGQTVKNTGRWTDKEKLVFLQGLRAHGRGYWKQISTMIPTRYDC